MNDVLEVGLLIQPVNTRDWERYEAGAFGSEQIVADTEIWRGIKRIGVLAEDLGFDALWMTEHHRTPYGMCPNPLQFLAYFAGKTQRIDLGAAVVVLPWHDPVRVAEDIVQLQAMAEGRRLRIGFGRGAAASEYAHLRIDQSTARERFDESIAIIQAALAAEEFSHDGELFKVGPTTIRPVPDNAQALVDDFFCAFVGEPSLRAAAKSGLGMCFNVAKAHDLVRKDTELFNSIRAENGLAPTRPMIVQIMYCAESDEEARAAGARHMSAYYTDAARHYRTDQLDNVRGYEHYKQPKQARSDPLNLAAAGSPHTEQGQTDVLEHAICGSPDTCINQIRALQEGTDLSHLLISGWYGEMPIDEAERSLRLFAQEVLPKVRSPQAPRRSA